MGRVPPPDDIRLRLDVAYDGTDFSGWAAQPGRRTVQGELEVALDTVLRTTGSRLTCAGRTDAGVHARGQVAHVDVAPDSIASARGRSGDDPLDVLRRRLTGVLPPDLRVPAVTQAPVGFDARFSATWRRYVYRVSDDPAAVDPLHRREVLVHRHRLDESAMQVAASRLVGEHDFSAYCKRRDGATTIRELRRLDWERDGALVTAEVVADAFCHSMVRALVGACLAVGDGRMTVETPAQILAGRLRDPRVSVVGPEGLTLEEVGYPPDGDLAARAAAARRVRTLASDGDG